MPHRRCYYMQPPHLHTHAHLKRHRERPWQSAPSWPPPPPLVDGPSPCISAPTSMPVQKCLPAPLSTIWGGLGTSAGATGVEGRAGLQAVGSGQETVSTRLICSCSQEVLTTRAPASTSHCSAGASSVHLAAGKAGAAVREVSVAAGQGNKQGVNWASNPSRTLSD